MTGSNKKDAQSSLEKAQKKAKELQSKLKDEKAQTVFQQDNVQKASPFGEAASTPNPSKPMDKSVLENIGIGTGSKIASSSVTSISSLSDVNKKVAKKSLVSNSSETDKVSVSSAIKVDPDYKPAFQSDEKAKLVASMNKPKETKISNSAPSLQSRLEKEQGSLYKASAGSAGAVGNQGSQQQLGGGFRMASDPNITPPPSSPMGSPAGSYNQQPATNMQQQDYQNPSQMVQHHEVVKGKGGVGVGTIGLLGGLLVAGGVGAVVMKPDLLSTTGISGKSTSVQTISAPEALIPKNNPTLATPSKSYIQPAKPQKMAAVQVMPVPVQAKILQKKKAVPTATGAAKNASGDIYSDTAKDIPLNLDVSSLKLKTDQFIRIGGIPDDVELSSGVDMSDGNWLLMPDAIDGLKLTAADGYKGTLELYMQTIKDDARTAVGTPKTFQVHIGEKKPALVAQKPQVVAYAPVKVQPQPAPKPMPAPIPIRTVPKLPTGIAEADVDEGFGVLPTAKVSKYQRPSARPKRSSAPARAPSRLSEAIPIGRTFSKSDYGDTARPIRQERVASAAPVAVRSVPQISDKRAKLLLKRGDNLYRIGDLISARSLYGQVAAGGSPEAAMAMGRTYDPIYFEKLGVQGFEPDPNRALEWYEKARTAGLARAQGKIDNLNYFLKQ